MENSIVLSAVISALSLLKNEVGNIDFEELQEDYMIVIEKLESALNELTNDE